MSYFTEAEFQCPCGECKTLPPQATLVNLLDDIRNLVGEPLVVTSGVRCPRHNAKVGGVPGSEHELGAGADIRCTDAKLRYKILRAAFGRFTRIGIGRNFIHLGVSKTHEQMVVWHYYGRE